MKNCATLFLFLLISLHVLSQEIEQIKNSGRYLWGEGSGISLVQADRKALDDLISQISVQVESNFSNMISEGQDDVENYTKLVIKTYSNTSLQTAERKVIEEPGKTTVIRYIEKTDVNRLFQERKKRLIDYLKLAQNAENELRIGDALKYYYWSLVLLRSHPDNKSIQYNLNGESEITLLTAIPDRINRIFTLLDIKTNRISVSDDGSKMITLSITFQEQPVENFDFVYWSGDTWSNLVSAKSGRGAIALFGEAGKSLSQLRLKSEYIYLNKSRLDIELLNIMNNVDIPYFSKAEISLDLRDSEVKTSALSAEDRKADELSEINVKSTNALNVIEAEEVYANVIKEVIEATENKRYNDVRPLFSDSGYQQFEQFMKYGQARALETELNLKMCRINEDVVVRSVPMLFRFDNNYRQFTENVVFTFNKDRKIDNISFALSDKAVSDISSRGDERWGTVHERYQLIQFMENFKTAYCLKRLDYIESIFDENALIIVGKILKKDETHQDRAVIPLLSNDQVQYIRKSKADYIRSLRSVFNSNEFVNIHFEDNEVKKVGGDDKIYGIQISQYYTSTNYSDKGYLFLMVDLNDSINPKIYVRTWQPQKNPDGSVIGLNDFHF